jgi:hypothetical protein
MELFPAEIHFYRATLLSAFIDTLPPCQLREDMKALATYEIAQGLKALAYRMKQ